MLIPFRDNNPSRRRPYVTYGLIAANIIVFMAYWPLFNDAYALQSFFLDWALIPAALTGGHQSIGLVTSMFLHGGLVHLFSNMLALHIFGDNLEDILGHFKFLAFYLFCGVASAAAHVVLDPISPIPIVGASGAIAGVMGGYLLLFPKARIDILLFLVIILRVISLNAWVVLGAWLVLQFYGYASNGTASGVAYWVHIAGFAVGVVLIVPAWVRLGGPRFWQQLQRRPDLPDDKTANLTQTPVVRRRSRGR